LTLKNPETEEPLDHDKDNGEDGGSGEGDGSKGGEVQEGEGEAGNGEEGEGEAGNGEEGDGEEGDAGNLYIIVPGIYEPRVMDVDDQVEILDSDVELDQEGRCEEMEPPPVPAGHKYPSAAETLKQHEEAKQERARKLDVNKKLHKNFEGIRAAIVSSIKVTKEYKVCLISFHFFGVKCIFKLCEVNFSNFPDGNNFQRCIIFFKIAKKCIVHFKGFI
jgi:hypothetical protein